MENGSILILRAPFLSRRMAREFFFEHSRRCHRRTTAKTISKYMYTASRPLVDRYLAHTSTTLAKSASTVLDGFGVSFEFGFAGNGHRLDRPTILSSTTGFVGALGRFATGAWLNGLTLLSGILWFVRFGGLKSTKPARAIRSLGSISSVCLIIFSAMFLSPLQLCWFEFQYPMHQCVSCGKHQKNTIMSPDHVFVARVKISISGGRLGALHEFRANGNWYRRDSFPARKSHNRDCSARRDAQDIHTNWLDEFPVERVITIAD